MNLYFENLTFSSFIFAYRKKYIKDISQNSEHIFYYIDASRTGIICAQLFGKIFGVEFQQLRFKMMDIKDDNGELIRTRIPRIDLFEIKNAIIKSDAYLSLQHESWKQGEIIDYIKKGLIGGGAMDASSPTRIVFIIEVVAWFMRKISCPSATFIVNSRPWFPIYKSIADKKMINLIGINAVTFSVNNIFNIIRNNEWLYRAAKNLKYRGSYNPPISQNYAKYKLFVDGRGDLDLSNNGEHSDFFWLLNSDFPRNSVLYECETIDEHEYLTKHGVCSVGKHVDPIVDTAKALIKPIVYNSTFNKEKDNIKRELSTYYLERKNWSNYFSKHDVKIYLTWYKYSKNHIAISDAINDNNGISAIWQMAFDGHPSIELKTNADVVFSYSQFSNKIESQLGSKIKYQIITGYPKDYVAPLLRSRAEKIRKRLHSNGAKLIVFAIDENSVDDSRWHTGHELQRENYSYILEKVLDVPWLGVIFKPKTVKTLYNRLGSVADLLTRAKETGRCFIYDESGRHTTKEQPLLAALSADVCIHGHLSSGTAALECALEGIPTLLIDREGTPVSKLNELPKGKVVFKDWPSTIEAVMENYSTIGGIEGFGDWSSIIDELDPFRDRKGAYRMGNYLHWLMQGYERGFDKEKIMHDAAVRYKSEWGEDKVICG